MISFTVSASLHLVLDNMPVSWFYCRLTPISFLSLSFPFPFIVFTLTFYLHVSFCNFQQDNKELLCVFPEWLCPCIQTLSDKFDDVRIYLDFCIDNSEFWGCLTWYCIYIVIVAMQFLETIILSLFIEQCVKMINI